MPKNALKILETPDLVHDPASTKMIQKVTLGPARRPTRRKRPRTMKSPGPGIKALGNQPPKTPRLKSSEFWRKN